MTTAEDTIQNDAVKTLVLYEAMPGLDGPWTSQEVFSSPALLDDILRRTDDIARQMAAGLTTDTAMQRKQLASVGYRIARTKTALDDAGKTLTADIKRQVAKIDAERKRVRDTLDALKQELTAPIAAWEAAEEERLRRIEQTIEGMRQEYRPGLDVRALDAAIARVHAIDPETCDEHKDRCAAVRTQVLASLAIARAETQQAEQLAEAEAKLQAELARMQKRIADVEAHAAKIIAEAEAEAAKARAALEATKNVLSVPATDYPTVFVPTEERDTLLVTNQPQLFDAAKLLIDAANEREFAFNVQQWLTVTQQRITERFDEERHAVWRTVHEPEHPPYAVTRITALRQWLQVVASEEPRFREVKP